MKETHNLIGVHLTDRFQEAVAVQKTFTEYGRFIKTRIGLHDINSGDSPSGIIVLEMVAPDATVNQIVDRLGGIEGVEVKLMTFTHEV